MKKQSYILFVAALAILLNSHTHASLDQSSEESALIKRVNQATDEQLFYAYADCLKKLLGHNQFGPLPPQFFLIDGLITVTTGHEGNVMATLISFTKFMAMLNYAPFAKRFRSVARVALYINYHDPVCRKELFANIENNEPPFQALLEKLSPEYCK